MSSYKKCERISFPEEETKYNWLSMLLDAYYVIDVGIKEAIEKESREVACYDGCSECCFTHNTIPVYPLELVGISWYANEKVISQRDLLINNLRDYQKDSPCPFLIEGSCIIHPLRPTACRQFIVYNKPCDKGEDPYYSRRDEVLTPLDSYLHKAFHIMLPFYGITGELEKQKAIEEGILHKHITLIQECNWQSLSNKMESVDGKENSV